jgi:hypothetical protein
MAYQNPIYCTRHILAEAVGRSAGNLTHSGTVETGYSKLNLGDYRPSSLFKWDAAAANHWIKINRGVTGGLDVTRMIIPAGHNLSGAAWTLQSNTSDSWPGTTRASGTFGSGVISETCTPPSGNQWWRLDISTSGQWELGQLVLSNAFQTVYRGVDVEFEARQVASLREMPFPSREATLAMAALRWFYSVSYRALGTTDLSLLDATIEGSGAGLTPFYFYPPDSTLDPLLMKIRDYTRRRQDHPNPKGGGFTYEMAFTMIEQIG